MVIDVATNRKCPIKIELISISKKQRRCQTTPEKVGAEKAKKKVVKKHDLPGPKARFQATALASQPEILLSDFADWVFEHQDCKTNGQRFFVDETTLASHTVNLKHNGNCLQQTDPEARWRFDGLHRQHFSLGAFDDAYNSTSVMTTVLLLVKSRFTELEA